MDFLQEIFFKSTFMPLIVSFIGGIVNFLSPCILPLIPIYMSYISGTGLHDVEHYSRMRTLRSAVLFVLGFSFVFFLLFLAMINLIDNIFHYAFVRYFSGGLVIVFGLHFLRILQISLFNKTKQLNLRKLESHSILKNIAPFFIGVGFAAGWTPCTGPIVSSIGLLASMNQNLAVFASLAFIIGLALPFLLLALFLEKGLNIVRKMKKQMRLIEMFAGIFLICVGILIIFGGL